MAKAMTRVLDAGFGHPRGLAGRIGGAMMAWGNAEQERRAVQRAGLGPGDRVVVVGHGPGVGLPLAAAAVAPGGQVVGVEPSALMREMTASRCPSQIAGGLVLLREGSAERTGCADGWADVAISVNNVMLWDRPAGFAELARVLRAGGRLVVSVHRCVLGVAPEQLVEDAAAAGLVDLRLEVHPAPRRHNGPKVELFARRP